MIRDFFDASVLVAAISLEEPNHARCMAAWQNADHRILFLHGVLESFASLTGGKKPHLRLSGRSAAAVLSGNLEEFQAEVVAFGADETMALLANAQAAGVRGAAIDDYMHLCAARKAGANRIFTLNKRHFMAIAPDLALKIFHPADL